MSLHYDDQPLLSLKNVSVTTTGGISLLKDIGFSVYKEKILTIIGPNGAGKTTLLKTLLGLISVSSGKIHRYRSLKIGYLPQKLDVDYTLPVTVNRFLTLNIKGNLTEKLQGPLFEEISIEKILHRFLYDLSGGELQRVLLVKALLNKPNLLVLDEPTQGMDQHGQLQLYSIIDKICQLYNCAIILVSHDLNFVFSKSHQVICINKHICCMGTPCEIQNDPAYQVLVEHSSLLSPYHHHHDHRHGLSSEGTSIE